MELLSSLNLECLSCREHDCSSQAANATIKSKSDQKQKTPRFHSEVIMCLIYSDLIGFQEYIPHLELRSEDDLAARFEIPRHPFRNYLSKHRQSVPSTALNISLRTLPLLIIQLLSHQPCHSRLNSTSHM